MATIKRKRLFHILLISAIIGISVYIFFIPYNELKQKSIDTLNEKQHLLAKQVASGIKDFFNYHSRSMAHLSRHPEIIDFNRSGMKLLNEYLRFHNDEISAITRVSSRGRIVYTAPYDKKAIGADISEKEQNRVLSEKREPVVSEVFKTARGYNAVDFAIPIIKNGIFRGSLSILISTDRIARRHCSGIRIGKGGYAWMLSKKGIEIYCPVPGHTGKTIYETSGKFPTVIRMAEKMMKGETGTTVYTYDKIRGKSVKTIKKHAVYFPINLPHNTWSVVVATPESHTLEAVRNFKNRWLLISLVTGIILLSYLTYNIRTEMILKEKSLRLKSEEALRESEEKFRVIAEQSRMGIIIFQNNLISYVNNAASEIFEFPPEEMFKWKMIDFENLVHPDFKSCVIDPGATEHEDKNIVKNQEWKGVTKNKREIWVECFSKTITIGNSAARLIALIDITARKKSQELLLQSEKMLTIGNLAAGMAHELNNPLGAILQGTQVIENRFSPEYEKNRDTAVRSSIDLDKLKRYMDERGISQYLKGIREAGTRAAKIVSEIAQFSRRGSNKPVKTDINILIDNTIDIASKDYEMKKKLHFRNIKIEKDYSEPSPQAICIHNEIEQVVLNILKNAAWALSGITEGKKKPEIRIKSGFDTDSVFFEISDNGPGMNEDILKHIFDPFFSTREVGQGTGLGLYVAYFYITTHHNGTITVKSKPGEGAKFRVTIPLDQDRGEGKFPKGTS
jgi:PAS domain S-box-containing protein